MLKIPYQQQPCHIGVIKIMVAVVRFVLTWRMDVSALAAVAINLVAMAKLVKVYLKLFK